MPRLLPDDLLAGQDETAARFGWQWQHFAELHPEFEREFLDWIKPIKREFFVGKLVLDAGCGFGRHTALAARFGSKHVIGIELSEAVNASRHTVGQLANADIVQGDILRPPFPNSEKHIVLRSDIIIRPRCGIRWQHPKK